MLNCTLKIINLNFKKQQAENKTLRDITTNMFIYETENIYTNMLQSILKISSYSSKAIVNQFLDNNIMTFVWKSISILKTNFLLTRCSIILSVKLSTGAHYELGHLGNRTSCVQVHELPQSHCGDNLEGTLFS